MAENDEQSNGCQEGESSAINNAWKLVNSIFNRTLLSDSDVDDYLFPHGMPPDMPKEWDDESGKDNESNPIETRNTSPCVGITSASHCTVSNDHPTSAVLDQVSEYESFPSLSASLDSADIVIDLTMTNNTMPTNSSPNLSAAAEPCTYPKVAWNQQDSSAITANAAQTDCWYEVGDRFALYPSEPSDNYSQISGTENGEYNETGMAVIESGSSAIQQASLEEQIRLFISNMTLLSRLHFELEEPNPESQMDVLHDELMLQIFSYVPLHELCLTVSPVCRRWRRLAYDPSLWHTLVIEQDLHMDPHWLCFLISRTRLLKHLVVRGDNICSESVNVLTSYCPLLTTVNFGFTKFTISMLEVLAERCPLITSVNFEGYEGADFQWVKALCQLKNLVHININYCTALSDDAVYHIARNTHNLKSLSIDGISTITDLPIKEISRLHSKSLECLNLDGWENTNASILTLQTCHQLKYLTVSFANKIDERCFHAIKLLTRLVHLQLRKNNDVISNSAYKDLFTHQALSGLTYLDLSESQNIQDDTVKQISNRCKKLRTLVLQWCWSVTDLGLDVIVENLWELERLDLLGIDQIVGHSFDKLPQKLPKLTLLDLSQCNRIDDKLIMAVLNRMPQLEAINFYQENFRNPS